MARHLELDKFEEHMRHAVYAAGDKALSSFKSRDFVLTLKEDRSPVTNTDIESQEIIIESLRRQFPDIECITEEARRPDVEKLSDKMFFVIDPLDGTSNFSCGIPLFSISVALYKGTDPVVGCLLDPIHGEYFHAIKGFGAYLNEKPIKPLHYVPLEESFVNINVAKLGEKTANRIMSGIGQKTKKVRCMGCVSLEVAWIAAGRIHGVVNHYLSIWDIAACGFVLEEAGGKWTTLSRQKPLFPYTGKFPICAAGTDQLHSELMGVIDGKGVR